MRSSTTENGVAGGGNSLRTKSLVYKIPNVNGNGEIDGG